MACFMASGSAVLFLFFFHVPATPETYTLSLHDALPISEHGHVVAATTGSAELLHARQHGRDDLARAAARGDRKSTRLNSSHLGISYAVFCLKKKTKPNRSRRFRAARPATSRRTGRRARS